MDDEDALKARCNKYGIHYTEKAIGEIEEEKETHWKTLTNQIRATQRREHRSNENAVESEERRRQRRENSREHRYNETSQDGDERRRRRRESDRQRKAKGNAAKPKRQSNLLIIHPHSQIDSNQEFKMYNKTWNQSCY